MSLEIEIHRKPNTTDLRTIKRPEDIYNLEEVQEIKDAIQEYFIFIGLDRGNHIRKISLMGIGTSSEIQIDSKHIVRTALINACDKVVFVHNHPLNKLEPSYQDRHLTDITGKIMKVFNIELVDHLIVTENDFVSMKQLNAINKNYSNVDLESMNKAFLIEENYNLKQEIKALRNKNIEAEEEI